MPQFIQPGNPDGSLIFNQLAKQEMPYDLYYERKTGVPEPSADELKALRAWIEGLEDAERGACATRKFVANGDMVASIAGRPEADARTPASRARATSRSPTSTTPAPTTRRWRSIGRARSSCSTA